MAVGPARWRTMADRRIRRLQITGQTGDHRHGAHPASLPLLRCETARVLTSEIYGRPPAEFSRGSGVTKIEGVIYTVNRHSHRGFKPLMAIPSAMVRDVVFDAASPSATLIIIASRIVTLASLILIGDPGEGVFNNGTR